MADRTTAGTDQGCVIGMVICVCYARDVDVQIADAVTIAIEAGREVIATGTIIANGVKVAFVIDPRCRSGRCRRLLP